MAAKGAPNDDKLLAELELVQSQVEKVENISPSSKNDTLTHRPNRYAIQPRATKYNVTMTSTSFSPQCTR
jgi:hypothetical protein